MLNLQSQPLTLHHFIHKRLKEVTVTHTIGKENNLDS